MTKIQIITEILTLADKLKSASVRIEEMRGICITFEDKNGDTQSLIANLDVADPYFMWHDIPYEELINELKKHTK